jgi:CsoR family transcriptional regulator, copper-sensing transcriptional repressor
MDNEYRAALVNRLKSAEGHIRGVERMVEDGEYCIDVIRQVQAVQRALEKVNTLILEHHLATCVTTAIQGDDVAERQRVIHEITQIFDVAQGG